MVLTYFKNGDKVNGMKITQIETEDPKIKVTLGNIGLDTLTSDLLTKQAQKARATYLVEWQGSKIPRGAVIEGNVIEWTQNGVVVAGGKDIGVYERLLEFGGTNRQDHKMIIFVK